MAESQDSVLPNWKCLNSMGCHIWNKARLSACFSKFESLPQTPAKESKKISRHFDPVQTRACLKRLACY